MKNLFIVLCFITSGAFAQHNVDSCYRVFNDTAKVIEISTDELLDIGRFYFSINLCTGYTIDTTYIDKPFRVIVVPVGEPASLITSTDTIAQSAKKLIAELGPKDRVLIEGIKCTIDGEVINLRPIVFRIPED